MSLRDLFVAVGFNGGMAIGGLQEVNKAADDTKANLIEVGKQFDSLGKGMEKVGKGLMTKVTMPLVGAGIAGVKTFIDMEDAFSGVKKTVEGTPEQLAEIKKELDNLSTTDLPTPRKALYSIAEIAGQLGVERENIVGFSEAVAKIGRVTDMGYDQGSEELARFSNIMGTNIEDIDRMGSTIVHLDKHMATSASQITSLGMRLAAAGKQAGMTEADVFGIAGTLSSVGVNAEAGGTAFSKVILDMTGAVKKGGTDLEVYGAIAGVTGEQFKEAFEKDAAGGVAMFIEGLGQLQKEGVNITEVIEDMGFADFRVADALRRAAGSSDMFKGAILAGNKAWEENIELNKTFEERTDNTLAKIDIAKNKISLAFENIGNSMKVNVGAGIKTIGNLADWFNNLSDSQQDTIVKVGMFAAAIGPAIFIGGKLFQGISSLITGFNTVSAFAGKAAFAFKAVTGGAATLAEGLTFLLGPAGLVIAIIGAVVVAGVLLYKNWDKICGFAHNLKETVVTKFTELGAGALNAFDEFKTGLGDIWTGIKGIFKEGVNFGIDKINLLIGGLNNLKVPDWVPIVGGKGLNIKPIKGFATGTNFFPGGQAIVGERGPERVILPRGSKIEPNSALRNITPESTLNNKSYSVHEVFNPQIIVNIDGNASVKEQMPDIKKEVEKALYPLLEEYWARMRIKRPAME